MGRGFPIAALAAILSAGGPAWAHPLAPRLSLIGFARRADVVLRGKVLAGSRPRAPGAGSFPHHTRVQVEKVYRGRGVGPQVVVLGRDDHALTYRTGDRAIFFLQGRAGAPELVGDQNRGERLPVRAGEEAAWDGAISAIVAAALRGGDPWAYAAYRLAMLSALAAPPKALRRRASRQVLAHLGPKAIEEQEAVLRAFSRRSLPDSERVALLGAILRWLPPARVEALAMDPAERPGLRGRLLEAWARRLKRDGSEPQRRRGQDRLAELLTGSPPLVRRHAAAALALLGDPRGGEVLRVALERGSPRERRGAIRGLLALAKAGDRASWDALTAITTESPDPHVRGLVRKGLRGLKRPPARGGGLALWIPLAAGVGLLGLLAGLWLRRRRSRFD